jgi:AcrR family transcriptional regulator
MGRWEPDARGRLAQAALRLYAGKGFEQTTVADIAMAAGLTERTFFRHFADKREVLFYGMEMARDLVTRAVAAAPDAATPVDAVAAGLGGFCALIQENPERARLRDAVVSANAELRERELIKLAALAAAVAAALAKRGVPEPAASLAAEAGIAAFKVAFTRWTTEPGRPDLPGLFRESMADLRGVLSDRTFGQLSRTYGVLRSSAPIRHSGRNAGKGADIDGADH